MKSNSKLPDRSRPIVAISLSKNKIVKILFYFIVGLTLASLIFNFAELQSIEYPLDKHFYRLFNVDNEQSIPTFYTVYSMQFCALLMAAISCLEKRGKSPLSTHWILLTIIFIFLSIDEALSFHEIQIGPLRDLFQTTGFLHFAWVIPAFILLLIFCLFYLKFLIILKPKHVRNLMLASGFTYVFGAVGMEMIGGKIIELYGKGHYYIISVACEECLEMVGIAIFMFALLSYLQDRLIHIKINFN